MAPNVKDKSVEQENYVALHYGGRRSPSSGAQLHDKGDVADPEHLWECKYTEKKSWSFKLSEWQKIHEEAYDRGRRPLMAVRFRDPVNARKNTDLVVMDMNDHLELLAEIDSLRNAISKVAGSATHEG